MHYTRYCASALLGNRCLCPAWSVRSFYILVHLSLKVRWERFYLIFSCHCALAFGISFCLRVGLALLPRRNEEANVLNVCRHKKYDKNSKGFYEFFHIVPSPLFTIYTSHIVWLVRISCFFNVNTQHFNFFFFSYLIFSFSKPVHPG